MHVVRLTYGAARQVSLERRNFLLKPQDPIIETLHRRRLKRLDHPVNSAQTPAQSCTASRWRLYCSHIRSRKLCGNCDLAPTKRARLAQEMSAAYSPYLANWLIRL